MDCSEKAHSCSLSHTRHRGSVPLLFLCALLLALFLGKAAFAEEPTAESLRLAIELAEEESRYADMILAAGELRDSASAVEDKVFALRSMGRGYALLLDLERALEAMNSAVELVEADMTPASWGELYRDTAGLLGELGRHDQSLELIERGLEIVDSESKPELHAGLIVMKGSMLGALGRLDEALETIESAMTLPMATERQRILRRNNQGMILKWRDEPEAALAAFQDVFEMARANESELLQVYGLLELGDVSRILGNYDDARRYLEDVLARSVAAEEQSWLIYSHTYLAALEKATGQTEAAAFHEAAVAELQQERRKEIIQNRATVLEVTLDLLEREKRIERLQMESQLQSLRLDRSRKLAWLGGIASVFLLLALWLSVQQARIRALANRKLDRLANTDTLTGLFNRRYLIRRAEELLAPASEYEHASLILLDLDRFKSINDQYGHVHGDAVLTEVAQRIQQTMRGKDVVGRWGGEEFLSVLPGCDLKTAAQIAERLRQVLTGTPIRYDSVDHNVTATFGVSLARRGASFEAALQAADAALYEGKTERDCVRVA